MISINKMEISQSIVDGDYTLKYAFLSRMKSDLEYYFGAGGNQPKFLYFESINKHIEETNKLLNSIPEPARPSWLTTKDMLNYEAKAK